MHHDNSINFIIDFDSTLYDMVTVKKEVKLQHYEADWRHASLWKKLNPKDYFYADSLAWLQAQRDSGAQIKLLSIHQGPEWSFDARDFQEIKITQSGIAHFVDSVQIETGVKVGYLETLIESRKINVFIDDSPEEHTLIHDVFPDVICIRMKRAGAVHDKEPTPPGVYEAIDFDAIEQICGTLE